MWVSEGLNSGLHTCGPSTLANEPPPQCWTPSLASFLARLCPRILPWYGSQNSHWLFKCLPPFLYCSSHSTITPITSTVCDTVVRSTTSATQPPSEETDGLQGSVVWVSNSSDSCMFLHPLCWLALSSGPKLLMVWPMYQKLLHHLRTYLKRNF